MRKPLSKTEQICRAIDTLGGDAKPLTLQTHIRKRFKAEISTKYISAVKTKLRTAVVGV
jgi:hypothetical protein